MFSNIYSSFIYLFVSLYVYLLLLLVCSICSIGIWLYIAYFIRTLQATYFWRTCIYVFIYLSFGSIRFVVFFSLFTFGSTFICKPELKFISIGKRMFTQQVGLQWCVENNHRDKCLNVNGQWIWLAPRPADVTTFQCSGSWKFFSVVKWSVSESEWIWAQEKMNSRYFTTGVWDRKPKLF